MVQLLTSAGLTADLIQGPLAGLTIDGVIRQISADLQPLAQENAAQLGDQFLTGIAGAAHSSDQILMEAGEIDEETASGAIPGPPPEG